MDEEHPLQSNVVAYAHQSKPVNIDDMPINGGMAKTFEELLESNLKNYELEDKNENSFQANKPKQFLKKGSKKTTIGPAKETKKYNYYVDNFEQQREGKAAAALAAVVEKPPPK